MFTYFFIMMLAEFFLRTNELSTTAKPACIIMILKQLPKSHEESGAGRNCWHLGSSEGTQLRRSLSDQLSALSHQPCPCPATPPLCSPHGSVSSAIPWRVRSAIAGKHVMYLLLPGVGAPVRWYILGHIPKRSRCTRSDWRHDTNNPKRITSFHNLLQPVHIPPALHSLAMSHGPNHCTRASVSSEYSNEE